VITGKAEVNLNTKSTRLAGLLNVQNEAQNIWGLIPVTRGIIQYQLNIGMEKIKDMIIQLFLSGRPRLSPKESRGINEGLGRLTGALSSHTKVSQWAHATTKSIVTAKGASKSHYAGHEATIVIGEGLPYTHVWIAENEAERASRSITITPKSAKMLAIPFASKTRWGANALPGFAGRLKPRFMFGPKKSRMSAGLASADQLSNIDSSIASVGMLYFPAGKGSKRKYPVLGVRKGKAGIDPFYLLVPRVIAKPKISLEGILLHPAIRRAFYLIESTTVARIKEKMDERIKRINKASL